MRRALPLLLLLLLAVPLAGCSFVSRFVVLNESDEAVEVHYTLKGRGLKECCGPPSKQTLEQFDDPDAEWRRLAEGEYAYDEATRGVTARLAPKEVLLVTELNNYPGHEEGTDEFFYVESIRVSGARGSIQYSGRAARTQFAEREGRVFAIAYR